MIVAIDMTSGPTWSQPSLSATNSEEVDRFHSGSAWRRDTGKQLTSVSPIVNGSRLESENQDFSVLKMEGKGGVNMNDSDHIVSVHNNPFFKSYGIRTQRPESRVDDTSVQDSSVTLRSANIKEHDGVFDEDEPGEYRPGSGFVIKLLGKFSSLSSAREENNYRPKRTSSLENLLDENRRESSIKDDVPRRMLSSLSKSVESVNYIGSGHLQPLKISASSSYSSSDSGDSRSRLKSPREVGDTSLLGRDDIIIIEKEPDKTDTKLAVSVDSSKFTGPQVISLKDEVSNIDELPKPNTVLSVRSMFEKSKSSAPIPVYSTATGPVVLSPTSSLKNPPFSSHKVSKVTPSISSEVTPNNVSKPPLEIPEPSKKRMAPKPPVPTHQQDQKTGLPSPKPRNKQSPVIAVAPFINETISNDEVVTNEGSKPIKKDPVGENELFPEGSVAKVFDSSAVIKPPVAPARRSRINSGSTDKESTRTGNKSTKSDDTSRKKEKPPRPQKRLDMNGTSSNSEPPMVNSEPHSEPESPKMETIIRYENDSKFERIFASDIPQSDLDTHLDLHSESETVVDVLPEGDGPVKGRSRFIAERLMRDGNKAGHHQPSVVNSNSSQEEKNSDFVIPVPNKRKNNTPVEEHPQQPRDTTNKEIVDFRKKLKPVVNETKSSKMSQVFSTKEMVRTPASHHVPPLDLTSITDDHQQNGFYQEGYRPTDIQPCKIVFEGASVKLARSVLAKTRTIKGKITFNDDLTKTYEYVSEEVSLQLYLLQNPHEAEDVHNGQQNNGESVLFLDGFGSSTNESSDDYDEEVMTPRDSSGDEILKSNPALSHSDAWSTYKSKYQTEEYTFGAVMEEPEPPKPSKPIEEEEENSQIVPAEEETTWSTETNSDLLF